MANFDISYRITVLGNEGGYDHGTNEAETYRGVDRSRNPNWPGWKIVDSIKHPGMTDQLMSSILAKNVAFQQDIRAFYKASYWDEVALDYINDQQLANNLFDCSTNQGEGRARQIAQHACNYVIHATGSNIALLEPDGKIGKQTIAALNSLPPAQLMAEINAEREAWYRLAKNYSIWHKVWEERLLPYKQTA